MAPEPQLYLAISDRTYRSVFAQQAIQLVVHQYELPLLVVDIMTEEVVAWTR